MVPPRRVAVKRMAADATATDRQGQGIGDIEAMKQMATRAIPEALSMAPVTGELMSLYDAGKSASQGDMLGTGLGLAGAIPFAGTLGRVGGKTGKVASEVVERIPTLWHGTAAEPFERFLREKLGRGGAGGNRMGIAAYSTNARQEGTAYLDEALKLAGKESALVTKGGNIPVGADAATRIRSGEMTLDDLIAQQQAQLSRLDAMKPRGKAATAAHREQTLAMQDRVRDLLTARDKGGIVGVERPGALYELGIDADPAKLLDYDKDLIDQSPYVQDAMKDVLGISNINPHNPEQLVAFNRTLRTLPDPAVTRRVEDAGILGVKGVSPRGFVAEDGKRAMNYAMFDPDRMSILRTLGLAGLLTGGAAASRQTSEQSLAPSNRMR